MMLRSALSSLLVLTGVASATAQTTPVKKTTKTAKTTTRRSATKTRSTTMQSQAAKPAAPPVPGTRHDIGPGGNGAVGSTEAADGKGQNAYAAPGMPVNVDNPRKVEGYNGPAPTKPRSGTTLTPR